MGEVHQQWARTLLKTWAASHWAVKPDTCLGRGSILGEDTNWARTVPSTWVHMLLGPYFLGFIDGEAHIMGEDNLRDWLLP